MTNDLSLRGSCRLPKQHVIASRPKDGKAISLLAGRLLRALYEGARNDRLSSHKKTMNQRLYLQ